MSGGQQKDPDLELRQAFQGEAAITGEGTSCPDSEQLWASAHEELPAKEDEALIEHLGECAACATAWRLARELSEPEELGRLPPRAVEEGRAPRSFRRWPWLAAAATLVVGVGWVLTARLSAPSGEEPAYRGEEADWLQAVGVPSLPRAAFVLRWVAGPAGTTYDVQVTSGRLVPIAHASALDRPEYRVGEPELADLAAGERILWRVTARLPDGLEVRSTTFVTILE